MCFINVVATVNESGDVLVLVGEEVALVGGERADGIRASNRGEVRVPEDGGQLREVGELDVQVVGDPTPECATADSAREQPGHRTEEGLPRPSGIARRTSMPPTVSRRSEPYARVRTVTS